VREHTGEDTVLLADVDVGRVGEPAKRLRVLFVLREDLHDLVRRCVGRRLKQHRVEQAKDRGVRADPESEHNHRCDRESWPL
jgi:hypothetical protein